MSINLLILFDFFVDTLKFLALPLTSCITFGIHSISLRWSNSFVYPLEFLWALNDLTYAKYFKNISWHLNI